MVICRHFTFSCVKCRGILPGGHAKYRNQVLLVAYFYDYHYLVNTITGSLKNAPSSWFWLPRNRKIPFNCRKESGRKNREKRFVPMLIFVSFSLKPCQPIHFPQYMAQPTQRPAATRAIMPQVFSTREKRNCTVTHLANSFSIAQVALYSSSPKFISLFAMIFLRG